MEETRTNLEVLRDCLAVVRDALIIVMFFVLAYAAVKAGIAWHNLPEHLPAVAPEPTPYPNGWTPR